VVPADKRTRPDYARKVFARNAERTIARSARCQYHNVVHGPKLVKRDITPNFDVAEEAYLITRERALQHARRSLGALMVRGNAVANQAKRHRQLLDDIDTCIGKQLEQVLGKVASGRTGTDDAETLLALCCWLLARTVGT